MRSCKQVFFSIIGNQKFTDEVLRTTFALVDQSLNARPITAVSSNPNELDAVTPNHFLLGHRCSSISSLAIATYFDHRKNHMRAKAYANAIWSRLLNEYVPSLDRRSKWQTPSPHKLPTGNLVWIWEKSSPRSYYPMAWVESLNYGQDSTARSANLKAQSGCCIRFLVKLVPVLSSSSFGWEDVAD